MRNQNTAPGSGRRAFTLVEMLVVSGIVAVLAAITLPLLGKAMKTAAKTRAQQDLNTISIALEAYKQDFGVYPAVDHNGDNFAVLVKALASPAGAGDPASPPYLNAGTFNFGDLKVGDAYPDQKRGLITMCLSTGKEGRTATFSTFDPTDGADGPGFRLRRPPPINNEAQPAQGAVHPAYLQPGNPRIRGFTFVDHNDNAIFYYPAALHPTQDKATGATLYAGIGSYTTSADPFNAGNGGSRIPRYEYEDGTHDVSLAKFDAMLGADPQTGQLIAGQPEVNVPFLLWTAGADGALGPDLTNYADPATAARKCDDVTNFR